MASTMQLEFTQAMTDFKTMFPDMDDDVIEAVLRSNQGAVDATIDQLLAMSTDNQNERLRFEMERVEGASPRRKGLVTPAARGNVVVNGCNSNHGACIDVNDESIPLAVRRQWVPKFIGPLPPSFLRIPQVKDARVDLSLDMDDDKIAAFLQNEEFMAELRWNQEFIAALDSEQGQKTKCHDDDAAFKERLKNMGKRMNKRREACSTWPDTPAPLGSPLQRRVNIRFAVNTPTPRMLSITFSETVVENSISQEIRPAIKNVQSWRSPAQRQLPVRTTRSSRLLVAGGGAQRRGGTSHKQSLTYN